MNTKVIFKIEVNPFHYLTITMPLLNSFMHDVLRNVCILFWQMVLMVPMGNLTISQTHDAKKSNNSLQNHKNTNHVQV